MVVLHLAEQAPGLDVPDAYGLVARGGDDVVGGESDGVDCRAVAEEDVVVRDVRVEAVYAYGAIYVCNRRVSV